MPLAVRADERGWEQTAQTPLLRKRTRRATHAGRHARCASSSPPAATLPRASGHLRLPRWLCCSASGLRTQTLNQLQLHCNNFKLQVNFKFGLDS